MSCDKPPWEQPQPLNAYPVTLGGLTEDPSSCDVPSYEQPQDRVDAVLGVRILPPSSLTLKPAPKPLKPVSRRLKPL